MVAASSQRHAAGCAWFWVWAVVGAGFALGTVSLGLLAVVPAAACAGLLWSRPSIRRSAFGLVTGVGALSLYVAYIQRAGPGTTCWQHGSASGCDQHLNPVPWLVLGAACLIGGAVGHARTAG